jgi:hypothetical protein
LVTARTAARSADMMTAVTTSDAVSATANRDNKLTFLLT